MAENRLKWREEVNPEDVEIVRSLCASSGYFSPEEVDIAEGLVRERLERGEESGYHFLFAHYENRVIAFACYGPIPGTQSSWDLYWLAVEERERGRGWGKEIQTEVEKRARRLKATRLYVWTSSRSQYLSTRKFYEGLDYVREATLTDYYKPGEHLIIYVKSLL